jgi:hypothetical protein
MTDTRGLTSRDVWTPFGTVRFDLFRGDSIQTKLVVWFPEGPER